MLSMLDVVSFDPTKDCAGIAGIVFYGVYVVKIIQIIVPIALIIWGSIDLLKSIISGDEKKISAARKPFIQRLISAVIVFLLPWIVNVAINFATGKDDDKNKADWKTCWTKAWESRGISGERFDPYNQ